MAQENMFQVIRMQPLFQHLNWNLIIIFPEDSRKLANTQLVCLLGEGGWVRHIFGGLKIYLLSIF